jgi:acetyltransferase-like isoleucine patch superfamily enzyme
VNKPNLKHIGIKKVEFGQDITVVEPVNLYGCKIGNDVFIGPFVEIQKDVTVGARTKVQSHTFICELVTIGEDCFIGHGIMFINDLFSNGGPARGDQALWRSTTIGNNVSIGSGSSILSVNICDHVVIGAGSVVTKNITESGVYVGNPAKKIKDIQSD